MGIDPIDGAHNRPAPRTSCAERAPVTGGGRRGSLRPICWGLLWVGTTWSCHGAALEQCQAQLSACEQEHGGLVDELRARVDDLEAEMSARDLAEKRMSVYRDVAERMRRLQWSFDPGELAVSIRAGRLVVELPNRVLFEPGKTQLMPKGVEAIEQVATIMKTLPDRRFLIAGHTDNIPVYQKNPAFKSNWELAAMRAIAVVQLLQTQGVRGEQMGAVGYGEFMPVANNDSEQGRRRNRRMEIVIMPDITEIVPLPEEIGGEPTP